LELQLPADYTRRAQTIPYWEAYSLIELIAGSILTKSWVALTLLLPQSTRIRETEKTE
jgi:hypothetical protein